MIRQRQKTSPVSSGTIEADSEIVDSMLQNMRRFDESLPMRLLKAREAVLQQWLPHLRRHGLSKEQWRVMRTLAERGELDVGALAEHCALLRPSVSRILQKLEADGFIDRKSCDQDNRRAVASISVVGRRKIAEIAPELQAYNLYIEERIGKDRLKVLSELIDEVVLALGEPLLDDSAKESG